MDLRDLKEMPLRPGASPPANGMDSVSHGLVRVEHLPFGDYPYCIHFGAMLKVGPGIWRGAECHCGAWDADEPMG